MYNFTMLDMVIVVQGDSSFFLQKAWCCTVAVLFMLFRRKQRAYWLFVLLFINRSRETAVIVR